MEFSNNYKDIMIYACDIISMALTRMVNRLLMQMKFDVSVTMLKSSHEKAGSGNLLFLSAS